MSQRNIDQKNTQFWNELCGSALARRLGIRKITPQSLKKYDHAYMAKFPYLKKYFIKENFKNKMILEMGLGYGTLGQILASKSDYHGIDIAPGPTELMFFRLKQLKRAKNPKVQIASALSIPYKNFKFDYVYAIGCLHHTGNLKKSIAEVHRVLKPKGKAVIMLYNRYSLRYLAAIFNYFRHYQSLKKLSLSEYIRRSYDSNSKNQAAPHTDLTSIIQAKQLFNKFKKIKIDIHKINPLPLSLFNGKIVIPKNRLTQKIIKALGSDLYITAIK